MSIAIVSETHFYGSNNAVSARMLNYAQALRRAGEHVYLLSYQDYAQGDMLSEISAGVYCFSGGGNTGYGVSSFFRLMTSMVKGKGIEGMLFYPTPNPIFELCFLMWKRRQGFKNVVCEVNEVRRFEQTYLKTFSLPKRIIYKLVTANSEKLTRLYKGIVCISENIREYFSPYNSNALVIPILSDISESISQKREHRDVPLSFVFTGSVAIEKENLVELLRGFYTFNKEYTNWEFLLYGKVPEENRRRLKSIIDILGLADKVKLMGEVEHGQIAGILASADCLILPRRNTKQNYYGFSTKLSEYAVSGTPIILTDTGVVFRYFKDGRDCLKVAGYEADGFCKQLIRFSQLTVEQRHEMAGNAYETARNSFDWRKYSTALKNFIVK